jgi:hypothetical protein
MGVVEAGTSRQRVGSAASGVPASFRYARKTESGGADRRSFPIQTMDASDLFPDVEIFSLDSDALETQWLGPRTSRPLFAVTWGSVIASHAKHSSSQRVTPYEFWIASLRSQ